MIITEACRKNKICCMHVSRVESPVLMDILEYVHALYSRTLPTLLNTYVIVLRSFLVKISRLYSFI